LHTNQGTCTPTHTLETLEARGKKNRWQLVTQLLTDHNMQGGQKYQYKIHTNTQWHINTIAYRNNDTTFRKLVMLVCILYWYFGPPCMLWSVNSCVTNCHLGFFPWLLVFLGCVWVCMCLGLYAILVFPRFFKSCEV
jgi:fatty acid desaturase